MNFTVTDENIGNEIPKLEPLTDFAHEAQKEYESWLKKWGIDLKYEMEAEKHEY